MKRLLMILLSVMVLTVAGCSNSEDISTETTVGYEETIETAEQTETLVAESEETEITGKEAETVEDDAEAVTEEPYQSAEDVKEENSDAQSQEPEEMQKPEDTPKPTEQPKEQEPQKEEASEPTPEPTEAPTEEPQPEPEQPAQPVGYSPQNVVSLAIAKCQAGGMITTQDNLANALAEGRITQEEYDEYYPYDGLENSYYSVFVETDLNIAGTISGQPLRSEDAIATYIANMLLLENGQVFNIVYAGVYNNNGTEFYEFRCLR